MLTAYIRAGMRHARYDIMVDEQPFYGAIPEGQGVWAATGCCSAFHASRLMPPFGPVSRRELIAALRRLGFSGPHKGGRHQFMQRDAAFQAGMGVHLRPTR